MKDIKYFYEKLLALRSECTSRTMHHNNGAIFTTNPEYQYFVAIGGLCSNEIGIYDEGDSTLDGIKSVFDEVTENITMFDGPMGEDEEVRLKEIKESKRQDAWEELTREMEDTMAVMEKKYGDRKL